MELVQEINAGSSNVAPHELQILTVWLPSSRLPRLRLPSCGLSVPHAPYLAGAIAGSQLRLLDLSNNALTGEALLVVAEGADRWPSGLDLDLARNALATPAPASPAIRALAKLVPRCARLELAYNALHDLRGIEPGLASAQLDYVGLRHNGLRKAHGPIAPRGVEGLVALESLRAAKLDLRDNALGLEGGRVLSDVLPACRDQGLQELDVRGCSLRPDELALFPPGLDVLA